MSTWYDAQTWKPVTEQYALDHSNSDAWGTTYNQTDDINQAFQDYWAGQNNPATAAFIKASGLSPDQAMAALNNYFAQSGTGFNDMNWWGDQARMRAIQTAPPA